MIEVFESEILSMVRKSQLKNPKLRRELDYDRLIKYLKLICDSSARFYIRKQDLDKFILDDDIDNINATIQTLKFEGSRILNLVSGNRLNNDVINEIVDKMINENYLNHIKIC